MEHTKEKHLKSVNELCRLCLNRTLTKYQRQSKKKPILCTKYEDELFSYFGIDCSKDIHGMHSTTLCKKCESKIATIKRRKSKPMIENLKSIIDINLNIWTLFDPLQSDNQCTVCHRHQSFSRGSIITSNISNTLSSISTDQHTLSTIDSDIEGSMSMCDSTNNLSTSSIPESNSRATGPITSTPKLVDVATSPLDKNHITLLQSLQRSCCEPLSPIEEKLHTHFVRRKLYKNPEETIRCKTNGQPIILKKIIKPRKDSIAARTPTKRRRAKMINLIRGQVAGGSKPANDRQHVTELKQLSPDTRHAIGKALKVREGVKMQVETTLAMKETVGLTWSQLRVQRRFLKDNGIRLPHEGIKRKYSKSLIGNFVKVDRKCFYVDDLPILTPYAYVDNIKDYLTNLLNCYKNNGQLTWHNGAIPEDEVWIKIGADHGKGSFKVCMSVANLQRPNSHTNTHLISMAKVKDTHNNLCIFMTDTSRAISQLQNMKWDGKNMVIFLHGDYDFLSKVYGLSGPQGTHPCIWCDAAKKDIQNNFENNSHASRTLESLALNYNAFLTEGGARKENASRYLNCIHAPLLDIPLERVCPPYLHILLGIVLKHHRLLEIAADRLDEKIHNEKGQFKTEKGILLSTYGSNWKKVLKKQEEIRMLEGCVVFETSGAAAKEAWEHKLEIAQDELDLIGYDNLTPRSGPVCSQLDHILDKNGITPQCYHSRSFTGNHCHAYLHTRTYQSLTESITTVTREWTHNPMINDEARLIQLTFDSLNHAYGRIHDAISHTKTISNNSLTDIQRDIDNYIDLYRFYFPNKIIPKQHILQKHCLPFIHSYKLGLGLMGEQGGEMIHSTIAKLENRTAGIRQEERKMKTILESHLIHVAPCLHGLIPTLKQRIKKE